MSETSHQISTEHPQIKVLFFAALREASGTAELRLSLPAPLQISGLLAFIAAGSAQVQQALAGREILAAINQQLVSPHAWVQPGDEVALFPPVTGG